MPDNQCWGLHIDVEGCNQDNIPRYEMTFAYAEHIPTGSTGDVVDTQTTVLLLEKSRGAEIDVLQYWSILTVSDTLPGHTGGGPIDTSTAWASKSITSGQWTTVGMDGNPDGETEVISGPDHWFYLRMAVGGTNESNILVSPNVWPALNTGSAFSSVATTEGFSFIQTSEPSSVSSQDETLAIGAGDILHGSEDHLQTWDDRASGEDLTRIRHNAGSYWHGVAGNALKSSWDFGTTWSGGSLGQAVTLDSGDNWTDVCSTDGSVAVAVGDGTNKLAISDDGGNSWAAISVPGGWDPEDPRVFVSTYEAQGKTQADSAVVIDQSLNADQILVCLDIIGETFSPGSSPWTLVDLEMPDSQCVIWSSVVHAFHKTPGPHYILWDVWIIAGADDHGNQYFNVSQDRGATWQLKTDLESPLS